MYAFESNNTNPGRPVQAEFIDSFFAPIQFDVLTQLASEHDRERARVIEVHGMITQEKVSGVLGYFFHGNGGDKYGRSASIRHANSFEEIFRLEGALNELTAHYWHRALSLTDLLEQMPQARRDQWHESLNAWREHGYKRGAKPELDMPEFNLDNLRATIQGLIARRAEFIAERVDGIFRALSRTHVTNQPEGFSKRAIMSHVFNEWGSADYSRVGYIHDLRLVVAKFMGRDEPCRESTTKILMLAKAERGEWIEIDGGSVRLRAYKVGTVHVDVHPEMAYRLNAVLAYLYPLAIPESFRKRPVRAKAAGFRSKTLYDRLLPNAVISLLSSMEPYAIYEKSPSFRREFERIVMPNTLHIPGRALTDSKHLLNEVGAVLEALGGVQMACTRHRHLSYWQFDYDPSQVIAEVVAQGYLPDQRSYQFYPTPKDVAQQLVNWLEISATDTVCEPQAGQGGIADLLPKDRTRCVEISPLHCQILRQKGHNVIEGDFLAWSPGIRFSVIAMNPPFSEGRWQAHLQHAGAMVEPAGRLGAVLPLSAVRQAASLLSGFDLQFSEPICNAFTGTSIDVVLLKATRIE